MNIQQMTVTPAMAAIFLKTMARNRPVRKASVRIFASDMREGRWLPTHQGIAFDKDGRLIDGQHRLLAVIESGATVQMMIAQGVDLASMVAIDVGRARDGRDVAVISGATDLPQHATWARAVITSFLGHHPSPAKVTDAVRALRPHLDAVSDVFGRGHAARCGRMRAGVAGAFVTAHARYGAAAIEMAHRVNINDALVVHTGLWWCRRCIDDGRGGGETVVQHDTRRVLRSIEIELRGTPVKCFRGEPDMDAWRAALPQDLVEMFESP